MINIHMIKRILIFCVLLLVITACTVEEPLVEESTLNATALNETAVSLATVDAAVTQTLIPTHTLAPASTWTAVPTIDRTRPPSQSATPDLPCDQAAAGHPIDVTIPDGTVMTPGESFSKTWRLENAGTCTWTRQYAVVYFSGNSLNAFQTHNLLQEVDPGDVIDVTVDMEAPLTTGVYQSNWMLSNEDSVLFGIGPNGDAPFWARIEVVQSVTETPQPSPTITLTPVVYLTGDEILGNEDQLDLDSATLNPEDAASADFIYQFGGEPAHILMTMNGTQWVVHGEELPSFGDCHGATMSGNAISFDDVPVGTYLCYRTSDALPGFLLFEGFEAGQLSVSYLTWAVP